QATLDNYEFILSYPIFLAALKTSVLLAAMAATIVAGLTFVMAWIAQRSLPRYGFILDALAFAPIAIPGVIVGAGILVAYLMLPIPIYNTIWILLVAYVTLYPCASRRAGSPRSIASSRRRRRSRAPSLPRFSCASCCRFWRRCCWQAGSMFSCWRCASSARRSFPAYPAPTHSEPSF